MTAMTTHDIEATLRKLRLSGMAETLQTRLMQAQAAQEPFLDTLSALLQDELDRRHSRLMARRFKLSGLTLVVVPLFYAVFFGIRANEQVVAP